MRHLKRGTGQHRITWQKQVKMVIIGFGLGLVFYATFSNISVISWRSVLLVEETGAPTENHRPVTSHWLTLSHNVVSSTPRLGGISNSPLLVVIGTDCIGSCKSNYHAVMTTTAPSNNWSPSNTPVYLTEDIFFLYCRQWYVYVTDVQCRRVGMQCWMFWWVLYSEM
jgi:hypothetical protein